ncbi:MAG: hypothetical protein CMJ67_10545 [Planctomycetaceae bacterium]|nr:hypothetical protein [Planctomycetaceae bacterium]
MKKRQVLYRKNPNKYNRKGPRRYERPDAKRVMARFLEAGAVMLYDQQNPANNEIKNPGKDVNYRAVGPTTWTMSPDERGGVEPGAGINDQTKDAPPASSRVIPDQMKQTLQDNLTYVRASRTAAAKIDEIMGKCGPLIVQRSGSIQFRRKRILPKHGMLIYEVQGSVGGVSDGKTYTVRIKADRRDKRVKALAKMPVKVSCSCPYFRWQGPEHWAKTNGYLYGRPVGTASKPVIKDPKGKHWVCKHVYAILNAKKRLRFASEGGTLDPIDTLDLSPLSDPVRVAYRYARKTS